MTSILDLAPYLPTYRLNGATVAAAWGGRASGQSRSVANYDEDTVTMAHAALTEILCEPRASSVPPHALYFASANPPYAEKSSADIVATACDLPQRLRTADFTGSPRAGTQALLTALDNVASRGGTAAVVVADMRQAVPGSPMELQMGDGAVVFTVGAGDGIAEVVDSLSWSDEFTDFWRLPGQRYTQSADGRFVQEQGYERVLAVALQQLLTEHGLTAGDLGGAAFAAPDGKGHQSLGKRLGLRPDQIADPGLYRDPGHLGTAQPFLALTSILERVAPGQYVALCAFGSGADVILLRTTPALAAWQAKRRMAVQAERARTLATYGHYLSFRRLVDGEKIEPYSSLMLAWREQESNLRRKGHRCQACGQIHFPPHNVCPSCQSRTEFQKVRLSDRGTIVTFTCDRLAPSPDAPVIMVVVDLDGGGRMFTQLVDAKPDEVEIGKRVEFVFRRFHEGGGAINYFWKFRLQRRG